MKLKRNFKTLLMIIATVMSVVSGILIDSGTLAYAATTYTLTLNWDDGVEWVATDRNGTDRWEKGGSKTFQAGSKAYTYVKLRNGATVKSFFSRQENYEWTDYTYISGDLCYDTWTMHDNRNVDIYTSVSSSADVSYDWDNLVTGSKHYHSSNGNESSWSNLRDDLGRSPAPVYSIYYKLQENRYRETCYGDNQEDKDFGGYEIMLRTEDSHNSYWYGQSSYANGDRFDDWYRDEFEGIKLSNLAIVPVQIKGDKFLQINISVKNTNSYAKEISLATCSDIQVADDDNAATFFNGNGFTMTNMYCETSDNYPFGTIPTATLNVYAKDVPGYVTDADAVYIGHFVYRKEHVWLNNVLGDKATNYNKYAHGGTSGEGELDSGFSIAWKNRTIAAGQTQTYSYIIGIGKYNSDNKITFNANGGELKTPGTSINNPSGNYSNKVTVTYGTDTYSSMSNDIPERAGYTFDGWWTTPNDSNASVMVYDASGKCNNDCNYWKNNQWQGTNDLTVYAHWKANTYTVRLNTGDIPSSELTKLTETASTEGWTWNENGRYFSKAFVQNENNYLPGVNKFFSANNYESVGSKVTDKYFVQDKAKNPTKVLYNWWTSGEGGTDIGRGKKIYNNLYEISKDNSGIVNLYPHWMGYTTAFNYSDTAPSNTAGQTVTINNNINDGIDNNLYQIYGNCFFYKGTDGEYHDYEGANPDLKVTASIPDNNGYKYIFNGWHHKNWNYLTDGLGKLTYKNNYDIGKGKASYVLSPHFSRVGISYDVRLNANVPENTESTLQVLHRNGISSYIYDSNSRYFSRELTYDDLQDMLSPDVYSLKGYHLVSRSNWYTEKTGGNTVSAPCNNTKTEYPDWTEKNWNLTTTDGATVDLYARWQANNYKIAYNLDGGTYGTSHPTSADYDTMVAIDNPSKAGYTFTGWTIMGYDSTTSGHNAATWTGETGTSYKNLTATDGATVTFTATWTSINYTISYDLNGGAVAVNNPTSYNIETPTFTLNNPTKTGYIFEGWCESKDTSYVYNRNANEVIKKDESDSTSYFIPECYASLDYAPVFDPAYYLAKYPDLKSVCGDDVNKALSHFVNYGMKEGRQGSAEFEVNAYKAKYKDLKDAFGDNLPKYYIHYILAGKSEGRTISQASISIYQGSIGNRTYTATWTPIEYSIVYTKGYTNNAKDDVIQSGIKYNKDVTLISNPFTGRSYTVKYSTSTTDRDWDKVTAPAGFNGTLEFAHWNILSKTYAAGTKLKNLTTKNGDKITATAQWKDKKFTLPVVSRPGYVFAGWYSMVDRKVYKANTEYTISQALTAYDNTFTAQWTAKTDTPYKVEHYKMNLDGTTYTLADTDNFKGTTDTSVTPAIKTYEGFTSPSTQTVTIKGDGTTVVKYYYTRNKYTLDLNGLINGTLRGNLVDVVKNPITGAEDRHTAGTAVVTVNGTVVGNKVTDYCNEVYYGSSISIITTAESGYNIIDNSNVNFKMPAEGKTVTVTINAKDTKYLVRHWKKNVNTDSKTYNENSLNDSNYTMYDAEYLSGKAYSWVKPVVRTLEGFTYKGVLPSEGTAYVKPDGTTVIDVYYTRNTYTINGGNVNANVEYGNGISSVSGLKTYEYEQKVTLTANLKTGYHWHGTDKCASSGKYPTGWYSRNNSGVDGILTDNTTYNSQTIKFNMPARNVYLGVKATNNSYTVVYNKNQPVEPKSISNVTGSTESQTFIYDESQNLKNNGFTLTGYTRKSGWMTASSKNGNGTADFSYGQSVKNLTTVNLGTVNLYAVWEDNAPEEINISSTNNFAATQTVTLTARDYGSGIDYISFGKDEKYEKVTCNADGSVTFTRKVNASGTYIFSVKDKNGKVSKKTITFYRTTLNTNKNNIVSSDGKNVIESDFTSVPETLSTNISINEAGKSITPVTKRDGVDFLGWSTDRKGKTGIISIKADGNKTCYAIWKDTKKPVAVLEDVTSNLSASQTITFKLYDTAEGKTNTGSDIAGYYIGTNPDAKSNTKKNVTADKNGTYSGSETITLNGETTYYIFPYDKAGNIGDTIKLKSTGNNNTPEITPGILFHRVDFNANGSTDSPATVNIPYVVIPHGSTITMPTAYRLGYHDYTGSDEQTADNDGKTSYWGADSKAVTGFNTLKVTKSQTCFALWKANKYTITLVSNKPDTKNGYRVNSTYSPESDTKITVTFDEIIPFSKAKNPEITGWTFKGYAFNELSTSDNNNSKTVVSTNQKFGLQFVKDWYKDAGKTFENVSDITLYAAWSENRYTVNYNTTGGTALKHNRITYWYEDEFSLPDATGDYYNTFMKLEDNKKAVTTYRPAHHFVMWKCVSDENSNGDVYSSGGKAVRLVSKNNGECTLNAVWKQKQIVTLNITSDTFKESMTNDYAALADAMWAEKGTGYIKDQTAIKEYTFTKTSDIKETK